MNVVHVARVAVPNQRQRPRFVPVLKASPFGLAHGGQTRRHHVVCIKPALSFSHPPRQVRPCGHAILLQRFVQLGIQRGQTAPLALKRFLVFRPRGFSKAPIFNALDIGQILEHFTHIRQLVIDGGKVREHHGGPGHKTVEGQFRLFRMHQLVEPRHHLEWIRSGERRRFFHES